MFLLTEFDEYAPKTENFKKNKMIFNSGDGVYIPMKYANEILTSENFMIKIVAENPNNSEKKIVYAKAVKYDAPENSIVVPQWMVANLGLNYGDVVNIESVNIDPITNIKFVTQKNIIDPTSILEFELRHKNILTCGDVIKSKIFEKSYDFIVKEIETTSGPKNIGSLYDNNVVSNIIFEIDYN